MSIGQRENVPDFGRYCASDDGQVQGHGRCRTTGTYVCAGDNLVRCSAQKANCSDLPGGCTELCDGIDNDCDGSTDEPFQRKGENADYFVAPSVTRIGAALWMYSYEASRPNASAASGGSGNGYFSSAPVGSSESTTPGDQDALLPTASSALRSCYADWVGLQGNTALTDKLYDLTGNLREIVRAETADRYVLMGGSYLTDVESSASCAFGFFQVDRAYRALDTGFRCCFGVDPTR